MVKIAMRREALHDFVFQPKGRNDFLDSISCETDEYARCLRKRGASCAVTVEGEGGGFSLNGSAVEVIEDFLRSFPPHVRDYILSALLMDDKIVKDEKALNLLYDFTSPRG